MKAIRYLILSLLVASCHTKESKFNEEFPVNSADTKSISLSPEQANRLALLPLQCIELEYPNKPGQTLGQDQDLKPPRELHPAFYGCFDWHSAVHGHWSLASLLRQFPELDSAATIRENLRRSLSAENIKAEVKYFEGPYSKLFERTYGWAWLLKLAQELHAWEDPLARELEENLQPLTDRIVEMYLEFLPKLAYPIREGTHPNTAFGLSLAYDYACAVSHDSLKALIAERALDFYSSDINCPLSWEPGGYDFLSPCLEEAAIMKRVLPEDEFSEWLHTFLPQLSDRKYKLQPGIVTDRTDGLLIHLDGVNFSRAWCLYTISEGLPEYKHLRKIADDHIRYSLAGITDGNYEGGHWLGSFAILALQTKKNE